jgi:phosphonatase-like hydrolase
VTLPALAVFDLAGTTVRDRGEVPAAYAAALAAAGVAVAPGAIAALRGASKREATHGLVPAGPDHERRAATVYADFTARLAASYRERGVEAVAGAREAFARLRSRGVRVALDTGFERPIVELLLGALGWLDGVVDAVVTVDDVAHGRPSPDLIRAAMAATGAGDPGRVAAFGDTALDLEAGARAGVRWNVGVLSGAHDRATLERCPHTHLIDSVASLGEIWPELG